MAALQMQSAANPEPYYGSVSELYGGGTSGRLSTVTQLHWPSEQVFYRCPVMIPYDSPILVYAQNGNVGGMRELFQSCQVPIDVVDPYGLGLLHVSH